MEKGRVARIDLDVNELNHSRVPLDLAINADARVALAALARALERRGAVANTGAWLEQDQRLEGAIPAAARPTRQAAQAAGHHRRRQRRPQRQGDRHHRRRQHQCWVPRHFDFALPERVLLTSSGHGTMGYDLPVAIGARLGDPDAKVVCFVGDGSLQMNIQELAAITESNLDIKIVVLDNHALNIVAQFQRQVWKSDPSTGKRVNPDFAAIARAYGLDAVTITAQGGMERAMAEALNRPGPVLIHCHVDPRRRCSAHAAGRPDARQDVHRMVVRAMRVFPHE